MRQRIAIIVGAGPAGLTAALELLRRSDIQVIVLQRDGYLGGISRTVQYKGNRLDIGGHRFFSKSDRVMDWWLNILPLEPGQPNTRIQYQSNSREMNPSPSSVTSLPDQVMLVRTRKSRIFFLRQFFEYPISLSFSTLRKLGGWKSMKIGVSYALAVLLPIRPEKNLEHFFINRFGRELYKTFFKSYTEKVWGTECSEISAQWGRQRIKGLSILKLMFHHLKKIFCKPSDFNQKALETSLIEKFLYPKLGPGQMWEEVGRQIISKGGQIIHDQEVERIDFSEDNISSVTARNPNTGVRTEYQGTFYFSTMALKDLVNASLPPPPPAISEIGEGLVYRDFITVGMLLRKLKILDDNDQSQKLLKDNWIYVQEPDVKLGRIQIFNNWSPAMVADCENVWIGLEYFCNQSDDIWKLSDEQMVELGIRELAKIGIIEAVDVIDATVVREPKTYPAYFGTYDRFDEMRQWLDSIQNLFPIGRNGMHRYNNQDHSMLTAMTAVDNILNGRKDKSNLWEVNTEQTHHDSKDT